MTPTETRAKELFRMVYHGEFCFEDEIKRYDWLKLGRYVLSLETKWAKAKKRKRV